MRHFICLTGVKQAGKSTFARIAKELNPSVVELAIADKLKNACSKVFNIPRNHFDLSEFKERDLEQYAYLDTDNVTAVLSEFGVNPIDFDRLVRPHIGVVLETPRRIAQYFGTEVLRTVDDRIHCLGTVYGLPETGVFVITDMRFPNEHEFFTTQPNTVSDTVYIHNARAESVKDAHVSEKYIKEIGAKCMWKLENNFTLETYEAQVRKLLKTLLC